MPPVAYRFSCHSRVDVKINFSVDLPITDDPEISAIK